MENILSDILNIYEFTFKEKRLNSIAIFFKETENDKSIMMNLFCNLMVEYFNKDESSYETLYNNIDDEFWDHFPQEEAGELEDDIIYNMMRRVSILFSKREEITNFVSLVIKNNSFDIYKTYEPLKSPLYHLFPYRNDNLMGSFNKDYTETPTVVEDIEYTISIVDNCMPESISPQNFTNSFIKNSIKLGYVYDFQLLEEIFFNLHKKSLEYARKFVYEFLYYQFLTYKRIKYHPGFLYTKFNGDEKYSMHILGDSYPDPYSYPYTKVVSKLDSPSYDKDPLYNIIHCITDRKLDKKSKLGVMNFIAYLIEEFPYSFNPLKKWEFNDEETLSFYTYELFPSVNKRILKAIKRYCEIHVLSKEKHMITNIINKKKPIPHGIFLNRNYDGYHWGVVPKRLSKFKKEVKKRRK